MIPVLVVAPKAAFQLNSTPTALGGTKPETVIETSAPCAGTAVINFCAGGIGTRALNECFDELRGCVKPHGSGVGPMRVSGRKRGSGRRRAGAGYGCQGRAVPDPIEMHP